MLFADWPAGSPVRAINNHYKPDREYSIGRG